MLRDPVGHAAEPFERDRLRTLEEYGLLDTPPEGRFDGIVELAANLCDAPMAVFSLVDGDRAWFKARVGLEASEVSRDVSICSQTVVTDKTLVVNDASQDARFSASPLVLEEPGIRFYAGVPVHALNGQAMGAICVMDQVPRAMPERNRQVLESLARELEVQLEFGRLMHERQQLADERAILTHMILHDASGMVAALRWNIKLLRDRFGPDSEVLDHCEGTADELMHLFNSVSSINDTESRDLRVELSPVNLNVGLKGLVRRISRMAKAADIELTANNKLPDQLFEVDFHLIERMLMNLVGNALQACPPGSNIQVDAHLRPDRVLELIVADDGPGVPGEIEERIFDPYFSRRRDGDRGAGLGLAFCRIAARALAGSIRFEPRSPRGAQFTVEIPVEPAQA